MTKTGRRGFMGALLALPVIGGLLRKMATTRPNAVVRGRERVEIGRPITRQSFEHALLQAGHGKVCLGLPAVGEYRAVYRPTYSFYVGADPHPPFYGAIYHQFGATRFRVSVIHDDESAAYVEVEPALTACITRAFHNENLFVPQVPQEDRRRMV